jgi:hypothetical protein
MGFFTPVFNYVLRTLSDYFGATYGAPAEKGELGINDPLYYHVWRCFIKPLFV